MKADRGIILSSKELYALKKNNSNCSLILISSKYGTSQIVFFLLVFWFAIKIKPCTSFYKSKKIIKNLLN